MIYKDSILNEKAQRSITLLQTLYKTDRAEKENQLLRKNQEIQEKEIRRQSVITVSLILGIIMAFLLIALIYNAFRIKRRAATKLQMQKQEIEEINMALSMQKEEILTQKEEIEKQGISIKQKNKYLEDAYRIIEDYINKITDSIKYAEQIQKAILPPIKVVRELFAKSFIFFKPKDIVSGDFYWFGRRDDKILFAAADCTGHVTDRLYRGYERTGREFYSVLDLFNKQHKLILDLSNDLPFPFLVEKSRKLKYLEQFYNEIQNPTIVKRVFFDGSRKIQ